ncbi:nuclear transport factor 2 family protein [Streptomyces sp. ITFR-16]|uniref:nuclear transport factor 2 family protein n=1 Tax=Streptomyces sp. ITFR-16 TaxID=3075198 RepID=UPI00288A0A02|nr:nuclear transport factor 2 family protein [Streptomyces sp. ITFR-16]WNI22256.1 nuclear transport factor 2 family protein [Streptomyces sp. ITFR-16]
MSDSRPATTSTDTLPEVITRYLDAHRAHDGATAITAFNAGAAVTDDGRTYAGTEEIRAWLDRSATEYTYTSRLTGARRTGTDHYTATHHLEGDFPGGTVDLHYRFTLRDGLVDRLVIEP